MNKKIYISLCLLFLLLCAPGFAETIILKSGKTVEGKIIEKTNKSIEVDIEGIPLTYYLEDIESIDGKKAVPISNKNIDSKKPVTASVDKLSSAGSENGKVKLRFHAKKGDSYQLYMTIERKIYQAILGKEQHKNESMTMGYKMLIEDVDEQENMTIRVTYSDISLKQTGPMGTIIYDSKKLSAPESPIAKRLAALEGASFIMKMDTLGRVIEVKGEDALIEHMIKKIDLPKGVTKSEMEKQLRENYNNRTLKEIMEETTILYPENAVGVGDSWTNTITMSKKFSATFDTIYTMKSRANGIIVIEASSNSKGNAVMADSSGITHELSAVQNGTVELTEATGFIRHIKANQKLSGQTIVPATTKMPEGASWPFSSENIITVDSTKQ